MAMRGPSLFVHRAWDSLGNGSLFSTRIRTCTNEYKISSNGIRPYHKTSQPPTFQTKFFPTVRARPLPVPRLNALQSNTIQRRVLQTSPTKREAGDKRAESPVKPSTDPADQDDLEPESFGRSEKAEQASKLNMSAKLSNSENEGKGKSSGGRREIWRLLKIASPEMGTLSWAFLFLLISSGITMSVPFSIGRILDVATQESDTLFGLPMQTFYLALGALLATGAAANYGRILILRIVGERVVTKLRSQLFKRTFIQNAEFFDANRVGDLISRLGSDTIIVGKSITQNLSDGLRSLVSAGAGLTMMAYTSIKLTGILAIMAPPVAIGAFFYGRAIRDLSRRIQKNLGTLTKIAEERLGNVRTSQAFVGELQEVHRYNTQVRKIFDLGKRDALISATFFSFSGLAGNMTFLALLYAGSSMVKSGAISVGDLTSFLMYTAYAGGSLFGLSGFYSELMKGVGAASRLFELQDRDPTISPTKGDMIKSARGNIEFHNVSFSYPTRPAVNIFENLSFTIPQGTNVAIVAPSGAGKSTVASLLLRFYAPNSGSITIEGKDISTLNAKQLRRRIGYVGQEPVLFSGTIAENIAYGRPLASRSEVTKAAREANCQFISDFPEGLETFVGARGTQLSGGQKQRIAIARALLKDPDILILDEATSALDAESETLVNQALAALLRGNNTTISIAHRLSTIQRSDMIICIGSDGKVAQTGPYSELSKDKDGAFAKLMEWQMSGGSTSPRDEPDPTLTEDDIRRQRMEERDMEQAKAETVEEIGQGSAVRGESETSAEAVAERTK
ncbi:ATP-binding cassette permease [Polychaeton citri CBS 116435]|uniref:ATP-binding cassette permease n=1 Tax=Polychaeton citri CBS 116435 TaxID=1314669 RepID=A0A9P4Q125_9PEZI|nr:ATP-binding cassette permease [Polychaeton citri CBS 116435]